MGIEDMDVGLDKSEELMIVVVEPCDVEEPAYGVADPSAHIGRVVSVWNDDENIDVAADGGMTVERSVEKAYQRIEEVA